MATLYAISTEYLAQAVTFTRGDATDVTSVGVAFTAPGVTPALLDFTTVTLVGPTDPLGDGTNTDILTLVGPGGDITLAAGDHQAWAKIVTATETIIRKLDTITVLP